MDPSSQAAHQPRLEMGTPPASPAPDALGQVTNLVKKEVKQAVYETRYPTLGNWRPLTTRQKLDGVFVHTYSAQTFLAAGFNALEGQAMNDNPRYENGIEGLGQRFGVELATSESGVLFQGFLFPVLFHQDPRYFRNPESPFLKRAWYAISRVLVTRSDDGRETFNASEVMGVTASQFLSNVYVPGQRQGVGPTSGRIAFTIVRDAGFNLFNEFWPDIRRKVLGH